MQRKIWRCAELDKNAAAELAEACEIDPTLALLLVSRGMQTAMDADMFLNHEPDFFDPYEIADMTSAVERIRTALDTFQKIAIFGDYDCDGITSTAVLYRYLVAHGADVLYHIPDRQSEGYGISVQAVEALANEGVQLILTVDNGISAFEALDRAKALNIDVIVTDHHRIGDHLPEAFSVIDLHREDCPCEYKDFSGVGVVFKLLCALEDSDPMEIIEQYGDIIALGTVADIVPLTYENRLLVQFGLEKLNTNPCVGLQALLKVCGLADKTITASHLGFGLAPRINAAGRIGNPTQALQLLLTEDKDTAQDLAEQLDRLNRTRQQMEQAALEEAVLQIESDAALRYAPILVVAEEGWHPGILGIVAARLVSRYGKPAIVISLDGEMGTGSCRSIEGFNMFEALCAVQEHLERFGGHPGAAGLGITSKNIPVFRAALEAYVKTEPLPFLYVDIDFKLNPSSITNSFLDMLSLLEPFGCENPAPIFGLYHMVLSSVQPVGGGKHLRLTLQKGAQEITAMLFGTTPQAFPYRIGDMLDLAVQIEKNEFRGVVKPSVHIKELRFSENDEQNYVKSIRLYETYKRGDVISTDEAAFLLPSRLFLVGVYQFMQYQSSFPLDAEIFCKRSGCKEALAARVLVAFDVLTELGLLEQTGNTYTLKQTGGQKVNLSDSTILETLEAKGV